jgi:Zn finger protein HypA/HybF involved in hydrogenase expression
MSRRIDPKIAESRMVSAGLQPLTPYKSAISDWKCKCLTCKKTVISRYNRVQQGSGCPLCGAKAGGLKIRLNEKIAINRLREYNLEPLEPYKKSDVKWKCRCKICGAVVYPKLKNLQRGDGGCKKCGKRKALEKNKMDEQDAIAIVMKAGFTPLEPYKNALSKWKMRHDVCKAVVAPKLNSISNASGKTVGCAVCSGHQVEVGFNDLSTTHPSIASEANGWDPKKVTAGNNKKVSWKCSQGHIWKTSVATRTSNHGCPTCSKSGFDPNDSGYLYLIEHEYWIMLQIGITNNPDSRLNDHRKLGWKLLEIRGPMDGHLTQQWETAILRMLKASGADLSNSKIAGKFDGYSEAWSKSTFPVKSIKELMKKTEEFEERN